MDTNKPVTIFNFIKRNCINFASSNKIRDMAFTVEFSSTAGIIFKENVIFFMAEIKTHLQN